MDAKQLIIPPQAEQSPGGITNLFHPQGVA